MKRVTGDRFFVRSLGWRINISLSSQVFQATIYTSLACVYEGQMVKMSQKYFNTCSDSQAEIKALQDVKTSPPVQEWSLHPPIWHSSVSLKILVDVKMKFLMISWGKVLLNSLLYQGHPWGSQSGTFPNYVWVSQVVSNFQVSPWIPCIFLKPPPHVLHDPPIIFFLILSPELY